LFIPIHDFRRIRNSLDSITAKTVAISAIYSKVHYCNVLFLNLPRSQLDRLQLILNTAARAIFKTARFTHISPVLKSLHWLKIDQRTHYRILSDTYKTFKYAQCSPCPIRHLHSFSYHYHSQSPLTFLSTQNNRQNIYSSGTCSLEYNSRRNSPTALHSSHASQCGSTPLLLDLSSTVCVTHWVTSLNLSTWLPDFHITFIFVVTSSTISITWFTTYSST